MPQPDWETYAAAGRRLGPGDAAAVVIVFSDYQCPYCKLMDERLKRARDRFPNEVMVVYRHFPLGRIHPHAIRAAEASECAGLQGAFEEMNTALFRVQDSIGVVPWDLVAERAGVPDLAAFRECLARPDTAVSATVERDIADGKRLGVEGTPAVLLAGVRLRGAVPQETLDSLVTLAVAARRKRP